MGNVTRTRIYAWPAFPTDRRGTDQRLRPFEFVRHVVFLDSEFCQSFAERSGRVVTEAFLVLLIRSRQLC